MVKKSLNIKAIRIDGGTQSRVAIDNDVVADYAEAIKVGIEFPPVIVFHDGTDHWLADGFHRYHAHSHAGKASIPAEVRPGTVRDAILFSVGANGTHGLRRSAADKRKAVATLLADPEWAAWSDSKLAKVCAVDHKTVASHRAAILGNSQDAGPVVRTVERAGKTYQQDTSRIGKTAAPAPRAASAPIPAAPAPAQEDLDHAREAVTILSEENERLSDRLAVEAMDASEEEKTLATETIASLREQVKTLTAELKAVKASRDSYMREVGELKKQCAAQRRQLDKVSA